MLVSVPKYGLRKTTLRVRTPTINSCSENGQKFFFLFFLTIQTMRRRGITGMANRVDTDLTAHLGIVLSESALFA